MEAWKRYIRRDDSHLVDLFVGQLKSTLQCTHCNHESVTFEPFWDLSLGIPSRSGDVSLLECFDAFTKEETLDGDEMPVMLSHDDAFGKVCSMHDSLVTFRVVRLAR